MNVKNGLRDSPWNLRPLQKVSAGRKQVRRMDKQAIAAIEAILKRGNDAKVRRKGKSVVVIEVKETIRYSPPPIGAGEGQ